MRQCDEARASPAARARSRKFLTAATYPLDVPVNGNENVATPVPKIHSTQRKMAMHATGLSIQGVIDKYLTKGLRMYSTHCLYKLNGTDVFEPDPNPDLSVW